MGIMNILKLLGARGGSGLGQMPAGLPGPIGGYGGGTWNTDGTQATPVQRGSIPGYPPPEAYPNHPGWNGQFPGDQPDMQPEPAAVSAPSPADPGPATAVAASQAPAKRHHGVLGALESVFAPEPGTFWSSALNNGLFNAKAGQQAYRQGQEKMVLDNEKARSDLASAKRKERYGVVGNNVIDYGGEGDPAGPKFIAPPTQPSETERLIDKWHVTPPGPERDLLERAIKGYSYGDRYLQTKGNVQADVAARSAAARGEQARQTKRTVPGKAPGSGKSGSLTLPSGYKVVG